MRLAASSLIQAKRIAGSISCAIHIAPGHAGPLLKNVAILGGLVHFFVRGPGAFGWDNRQNQGVTSTQGLRLL